LDYIKLLCIFANWWRNSDLKFKGWKLNNRYNFMRQYHHLGIPTSEMRNNETYLEKYKLYVSGYEESPYGIEWMRYEPDSPLPELVKTIPHVAFKVDNLEEELIGKEVIIQPNSPSKGVLVAFIVENGAPIEFLQIDED
jgi:hypothetical protein